MKKYIFHIYLRGHESYIPVFGTETYDNENNFHIVLRDEDGTVLSEAIFYYPELIGITKEVIKEYE